MILNISGLGGLSTALLAMSYLSSAVAPNPYPITVEKFDWPQQASKMLRDHLYPRLNQRYTEEQADSFLSNALRHLVDETVKLYAITGPGKRVNRPFETSIRHATALTGHRLVVEGIEQALPTHRLAPNWLSAPLLEPSLIGPKVMQYHHVRLPNNKIVRSPDVIRLDKFTVKRVDGFWLPTAIVRPYYDVSSSSLLKFKVVHEFPTSVDRYRRMYQVNPELAAESLKHALEVKQDIWTQKLNQKERDMITTIWSKAPGSELLETSPYFPRKAGKSALKPHGLPSSSSAGGESKPEREVIDVDSDSDGGRQGSKVEGEASTSGAPRGHGHQPELVEYDFFGLHGQNLGQPFRPRPVYPAAQSSLHQQPGLPPGFVPSSVRSLDREHKVDLDLSLAPPTSRRNS